MGSALIPSMSSRQRPAPEPAVRAGSPGRDNRYGRLMTSDPRAALDRLVAALEAHLAAASRRTGEAAPAVASAFQTLADAFNAYDEALYEAYDEVTPFVLYDEAEDDDLDDEDDEDDEDDDHLDDEDDDDIEDVEDDLELDLGVPDAARPNSRG